MPVGATAAPRRGALAEDRFPIFPGEVTGATLLFDVDGAARSGGGDLTIFALTGERA